MSNDVTVLLSELRQDHKNMALMLNLLERECNVIYEGEEPDYELLHDIMQYMTVYPDAVHHPKEDRIYEELKTVRPDLSGGFSRITLDHRKIAELGVKLRDEIASICAGNVMRRNAVVANGLRYVNTMRGHMQWEELDLFRRIEEMVSEGHRLIDATRAWGSEDPVFGPEIEQTFGRLVSAIEAGREAGTI